MIIYMAPVGTIQLSMILYKMFHIMYQLDSTNGCLYILTDHLQDKNLNGSSTGYYFMDHLQDKNLIGSSTGYYFIDHL